MKFDYSSQVPNMMNNRMNALLFFIRCSLELDFLISYTIFRQFICFVFNHLINSKRKSYLIYR
jgi:hypothetical protein